MLDVWKRMGFVLLASFISLQRFLCAGQAAFWQAFEQNLDVWHSTHCSMECAILPQCSQQ